MEATVAHRRFAAAFLLALLVANTSCDKPGPREAAAGGSTAPTTNAAPPGAGPPVAGLGDRPSEAPRKTYITPVPTPQSVAEALADGVATSDEYAAANARMVACLDAAGVEHSTPVYDESNLQYRYSVV